MNSNFRQQKVFLRKARSQVLIFKDKFVNFKKISKFILPFLVGTLVIMAGIYFIVSFSYSNKIVRNFESINSEFNIAVILSTNESSPQKSKHISTAKELIQKRLITKAYVVDIGDSIPVEYDPQLLGERLYFADFFSFCKEIFTVNKLHKFIIIGSESDIILSSFICNSQGIYTQGFMPDNGFTERVNVFVLLKTVITLIFNPDQ